MAAQTDHPPQAHGEAAHANHSTRIYWIIGAALAVATATEVGTFLAYQNDLIPKFVEVIILLVLTFVKGSGVVLYFMHLQGDRAPYWFMFLAPLSLAITLVLLMNVVVHAFTGVAG